MTQEEINKCLEIRKKSARAIAGDPSKYKVCEHCGSISSKKAGVCVICAAYVFEEAPQKVIDAAKKLGESPFPMTSAIVPRYIK